jgi:hypothetical protein
MLWWGTLWADNRQGGNLGRRPNYSYEKRQRELKKQKKKERKLAKKGQAVESAERPPEADASNVGAPESEA